MIDLLKNKEVIFFDVGYTLDMPASGDWMFTNRFLELAGDKLKQKFKWLVMPDCVTWHRII